MGRLAERHAQHARTSGGNNFRVRLLEELHCHTPTHEQLLHEGRAGIASSPALLPVLFRKLRAPETTVNFYDHTFRDASALLSGFKNIPARFTARQFLPGSSAGCPRASGIFIDGQVSTLSPPPPVPPCPRYFHPRCLSLANVAHERATAI